MWNTFWPDVIVAVIAATLTVLIAYVTYVLNRHRRERQLLLALASELHTRRALTISRTPRRIRRAKKLTDYAHVTASVLSVKQEIRDVRDRLRPLQKFRQPLFNMTVACNAYLEESSRDPDAYEILVTILSLELRGHLLELPRSRQITHLAPGAGAFTQPSSSQTPGVS